MKCISAATEALWRSRSLFIPISAALPHRVSALPFHRLLPSLLDLFSPELDAPCQRSTSNSKRVPCQSYRFSSSSRAAAGCPSGCAHAGVDAEAEARVVLLQGVGSPLQSTVCREAERASHFSRVCRAQTIVVGTVEEDGPLYGRRNRQSSQQDMVDCQVQG